MSIVSRSLLFAAVVLPALAAPARAQSLPVQLEVDYAAFMYDDEATLVEFYLGVEARSLDYAAADGGGFTATLPLRLVLRPTAASAPAGASAAAVWERETALRFSAADTAALAPGQFFLDRIRATVPPGEYALDVIVPADGASERGELRINLDPVVVPDYSEDDLAALSSLALATAIRPSEDRDGSFYRNGLDVVPNPSGVFGEGLAHVNFYAEVYGVPEALGSGPYTMLAFISASATGAPLPGLEQRVQREARDPDVIAGGFDLRALPTGGYELRLAVLDEANEAVAEQRKRFFVVNPNVAAPELAGGAADLDETRFAVMGEEEVDRALRQARALASSSELSQMGRLQSLDARRAFLTTFWRNRDDDADPSQNLAYNEFQERLRAVDRFGRGTLPGFETARGRVYLKYGQPAEVDPRPLEPNMVAHEVWTYYDIPGHGGRRIFVFADREGMNMYDLLYSDVTGEPAPPNWEQQLQR